MMMMKFSLFAALAVVALLNCAQSHLHDGEDHCPETVIGSSIGLRPLNYESETMMNIFLDKKIERYGNVSTWRYYATRAGDAYFSVWRRDGPFMRLVGSNAVSSTGKGLQTLVVPVDEQIIVEKGDVIGTHYPVKPIASGVNEGIMYYEDSRDMFPRTAGIDGSKFSSIIAEPLYHNYLSISRLVIPRIRSVMTRQVALNAVVVCETCPKLLMGSSIGLKRLNYESKTYLNIFMDKKFVYSGALTTWRYLALRSGDLYLGVWRQDSLFELIGFNKVSCPGKGLQEFQVPESEQIQVQIGDMIGVHYPDETEFQDKGVLYYEDLRYERTEGIKDEDLSTLVAVPLFADYLQVGQKIYGDKRADIRRDISMEAVVASTADCR